MKVCVEIIVEGSPDATPELLKIQVDQLFIAKALRFPPDRRFDWKTAECVVSSLEPVKTP